MTTVAAGRRSGLIVPNRSTATSESAQWLEKIYRDIRRHLLGSYTVRGAAEQSLDDLEEVRSEADKFGWNGYGALPLHPDAYENAKLFLEAMPTLAPLPEISADPDGDVALDWVFGPKKALSVSIAANGRCSFAWMRGQRTYRGTEWLDYGVPDKIAQALWELATEAAPTERIR